MIGWPSSPGRPPSSTPTSSCFARIFSMMMSARVFVEGASGRCRSKGNKEVDKQQQ